jgi:hypothetical protein
MPVEVAPLVLNVNLVGFIIVYPIVRPKTSKRQMWELIEEACQRWKTSDRCAVVAEGTIRSHMRPVRRKL